MFPIADDELKALSLMQLVAKYGHSPGYWYHQRKARGIKLPAGSKPGTRRRLLVIPDEDLFGPLSCKKLARKHHCSILAVADQRRARGIPVAKPHQHSGVHLERRTPEECARFGLLVEAVGAIKAQGMELDWDSFLHRFRKALPDLLQQVRVKEAS
jgi:hypothetical protein